MDTANGEDMEASSPPRPNGAQAVGDDEPFGEVTPPETPVVAASGSKKSKKKKAKATKAKAAEAEPTSEPVPEPVPEPVEPTPEPTPETEEPSASKKKNK